MFAEAVVSVSREWLLGTSFRYMNFHSRILSPVFDEELWAFVRGVYRDLMQSSAQLPDIDDDA